jgi:integrase
MKKRQFKERKVRTYPSGTKVQSWTLSHEKQRGKDKPVIRRWVTLPDGKTVYERYPAALYRAFLDNPDELEKLVIRLNGAVPEDLKRKQRLIINHAYIDDGLLAKYLDTLRARLPSEAQVTKEYHYLRKYFLHFFINRMGLANPLEWHLNQELWCWALLNKFPENKKSVAEKYRVWKTPDHLPSEKTITEIIQSANRFMAWLHQRRPLDAKALVFEPVSKAQKRDLRETRRRLAVTEDGVFIPDTDWEEIKKNLPSEIRPFVMLAYYYGLRRAETLGVREEDVMEDHLKVRRQLDGLERSNDKEGSHFGRPNYENTKGRMARKVPNWFCEADDAYEWISEIFEKKLIVHQSTLSHWWHDLMKTLGMDYGMHDLRHTWTTKAVMKHPIADVMLAAGHENMETTMGYFHDSRELSEKRFVPRKKKSA